MLSLLEPCEPGITSDVMTDPFPPFRIISWLRQRSPMSVSLRIPFFSRLKALVLSTPTRHTADTFTTWLTGKYKVNQVRRPPKEPQSKKAHLWLMHVHERNISFWQQQQQYPNGTVCRADKPLVRTDLTQYLADYVGMMGKPSQLKCALRTYIVVASQREFIWEAPTAPPAAKRETGTVRHLLRVHKY